MGERRWRRRKRFDNWFGDFFQEADKMERLMDNMIRQAFGSVAEREKARRRYVYQFGDFPSARSSGSQINEEYEPLVDVFLKDASVMVIAELRGVDKDSIQIYVTEDKLTISVDSPQRKYYKELHLPARVDPESSATSYKNGVLAVHLKKLVGERLLIK